MFDPVLHILPQFGGIILSVDAESFPKMHDIKKPFNGVAQMPPWLTWYRALWRDAAHRHSAAGGLCHVIRPNLSSLVASFGSANTSPGCHLLAMSTVRAAWSDPAAPPSQPPRKRQRLSRSAKRPATPVTAFNAGSQKRSVREKIKQAGESLVLAMHSIRRA